MCRVFCCNDCDNGKVVWQGNFGVKETGTFDSVNAETIFEAVL
jgi:hypothetical protein